MSNSDESGADSIYRAPTSNTAVAPSDNLLSAYLGPKNAHFYESKFGNFEAGGGSVSWNWPAFFATWFWLMYRKMWALSFVYWLLIPIVMAVLMGVISAAVSPAAGALFYYTVYGTLIFVLAPMFANRIYYNHAKRKIAKVTSTSLPPEQQALELARIGGTSNIALVLVPAVVVIGILAAIAIPAYQDYTVRAQVAEGLYLSSGAKAAVDDYYFETEEWPEDNRAAGLADPQQISGSYVSGIYVEDGSIVVSYGNQAHTLISNRTLELYPTDVGGGRIEWACMSSSIAAKHLPAACR